MAFIESRVPPLVLTRSGNAGRASTLLSARLSRLPVQLCNQYMTVAGGCQVKKYRRRPSTWFRRAQPTTQDEDAQHELLFVNDQLLIARIVFKQFTLIAHILKHG